MKALNTWLDYLNSLPRILNEPAVSRCQYALDKLNFTSFSKPIIAITGTNGKGSSCALLNAIWQAQGYRCAVFTSPHLLRFNERFKINNQDIDDKSLIEALDYLYNKLNKESLSYFDYCFLIAIYLFQKSDCDLIILEAGIGGRLDAVNAINADLVLITQIGHDHVDLLGNDRESIAYEKAGLMRPEKPLVFAEPLLPQSIKTLSATLPAPVYAAEDAYHVECALGAWSWSSAESSYKHLPYPRIHLSNASACLMVIDLMRSFLPVHEKSIIKGLSQVYLPARCEKKMITRHDGKLIEHIFDVAHNLESVACLSQYLQAQPSKRTIAIFSMLNDKDITSVIKAIQLQIDDWYIAPLETPRAFEGEILTNSLTSQGISSNKIHIFQTVVKAYQAALAEANESVRICVFGSFYTVRNVLGFATPML